MFDGLLSKKSDRRLAILAALILLDALTFIIFDVYASTRSGVNAHPFNTLAGAWWLFDFGHILSLLSGNYGIDYILAAVWAFYIANRFIINKVATILLSGIVVVCIYRYAPDLLYACYGYLLGVACVGTYEGLLNIGAISPGGLSILPLDIKIIPQALMTICVVAGGIISLSKVAAYVFSQIVALQLFEDGGEFGFHKFSIPLFGRLLNSTAVPARLEDHKLLIPPEFRSLYEKNIKELADLDTQNSIEAIQRSYDLVNQMAEKYGVDQYHVMYDVYKEKKKPDHQEKHVFSNIREHV